VLPVTWDTVRVFLHVLAATIWVGGQFTLAAVVPVLRGVAPDATRPVARRFNTVAWAAFGVLAITGIWNILAAGDIAGSYRTTLIVKVLVVAVSGATALAHARAKSTAGLAAFGALTALSALAALFVGVMLGG
jgi:putative copper export protein